MKDTMEAVPVLSVRDLCIDIRVHGKSTPLLLENSFDIHEREVFGLIGESGAGMTILSRAIVNWLPQPLVVSRGEIYFKGKNIFNKTGEIVYSRGKEIAYIGSDPTTALDPTVSIGKQLVEKLKAISPGISDGQARKEIYALFDAVRIPSPRERFNEFPFQFSGGMMQRVMIVDALSSRPDLLIADNITQPLDVTVAKQIVNLIEELRTEFDTSVLFISTSLPVVSEISQKIMVLQKGRIIESATPQSLLENPKTEYTKKLLSQVPRIWSEEHTPQKSITQKPILSVKNVTKTYYTKDPGKIFAKQAVRAVRGVTFDILEGENFGIVGESGCGKSTLSRLLSWVESPDNGEIRFEGRNIGSMNKKSIKNLRKNFQLILQDPYTSIPAHLTVGQIIAEPMKIHNMGSNQEIRDRVAETMDEVGLEPESINLLPSQLSASHRQRVNIARAMVMKPKLIILDETLSSLDQVEQSRLLQLFNRLQVEHKFTYIFISHDLALVRKACSKIAVMYLGRMVEIAENESLFFSPEHPYTKAMLSAMPTIEEKRFDPKIYLLEGEPPSPVNISKICSFRTRCPFVMDVCGHKEPPANMYGTSRVECHLPQGGTE